MNPIPIEVLKELRSGHERFLSGFSSHPHNSRDGMLKVEGAQHPIAAVLGCADSWVPVELLFDTGFGDLFVVGNTGTMSTTAAIASLEYAVAHLAVPAIVVLGHQRCGAVVVCGRIGCRSKRLTTTSTRPGLTGWVPCCPTAFPGISGDGRALPHHPLRDEHLQALVDGEGVAGHRGFIAMRDLGT